MKKPSLVRLYYPVMWGWNNQFTLPETNIAPEKSAETQNERIVSEPSFFRGDVC